MTNQEGTKQERPKSQAEQIATYHTDSPKQEIKQRAVYQTNVFNPQNCVLSSYQFPNFADFKNVFETGNLLSDFAQQLPCKNVDVPDIYLILLEIAGEPPTLVLNQNATTKQRGS